MLSNKERNPDEERLTLEKDRREPEDRKGKTMFESTEEELNLSGEQTYLSLKGVGHLPRGVMNSIL